MAKVSSKKSSGNIFADMGFSPAEAEDLAVKSALIMAIKDIMANRRLTQKKAASLCTTDQPTLSKVLHGRLESVTIDRLAHWLMALGLDVEITVRPAPRRRHGRMHVSDAA